MKKVKLVKKALLPAVIAVCCSLLALTSVSYAWFTQGNTAEVGDINVNVQSADGLQISHNGTDWKSILPVNLLESLEGNQFKVPEGGINPTSSAGNLNDDNELEIFDGEFKNDKLKTTDANLDENSQEKTEKNYIAFDLYVKLDNAKVLFLSKESTVTATGDTQSQAAVRVAFVLLDDASTQTKALIWEPNYTATPDSSKQHADKVPYYGVKSVSDFFAIQDEEGNYSSNLEEVETKTNDADLDLFGELAAGVRKFRVYIWLEGQDVDCINDISGNGFTVSLKFLVPEEE